MKAERSLISQTDCLSVLSVAQKMLPQLSVQMTGNLGDDQSENEQVSLISDGNANSVSTVAGICSTEEVVRLRRLVFRASRGQAFVYIEEVEQANGEQPLPVDQLVRKSVYLILFFGSRLESRLTKICDSFTSERFDLPATGEEIGEKVREVRAQINDSRLLLSTTRRSLRDQLREFDRVEEDNGGAINEGGDEERR